MKLPIRPSQVPLWVSVILDATRTRRLDLNERTWKLASNALARVNCIENARIPFSRIADAGIFPYEIDTTARMPEHHKSCSSSLEH